MRPRMQAITIGSMTKKQLKSDLYMDNYTDFEDQYNTLTDFFNEKFKVNKENGSNSQETMKEEDDEFNIEKIEISERPPVIDKNNLIFDKDFVTISPPSLQKDVYNFKGKVEITPNNNLMSFNKNDIKIMDNKKDETRINFKKLLDFLATNDIEINDITVEDLTNVDLNLLKNNGKTVERLIKEFECVDRKESIMAFLNNIKQKDRETIKNINYLMNNLSNIDHITFSEFGNKVEFK